MDSGDNEEELTSEALRFLKHYHPDIDFSDKIIITHDESMGRNSILAAKKLWTSKSEEGGVDININLSALNPEEYLEVYNLLKLAAKELDVPFNPRFYTRLNYW